MPWSRAFLALLLIPAAGCHSAYVEAVLTNQTGQPLTLVEVDYPSASFGTQALTPGQDFRYRFKILGDGPVKLIYTDAQNKEHHIEGPQLREGQEGSLHITVAPGGVRWDPVFARQ